MAITILGLGPGPVEQLTCEAWRILNEADEIYVRTRRHPTLAGLPERLTVHSFDVFYEQAQDFDQVYEAIAGEVLRLGQRPSGVIYAVPGHPLVGEATVTRILALAGPAQVPVRIVGAPSFIEPTLVALRLDALAGLQMADALDLAARHHPPLNPDVPAIIGQLYDREVASGVKLTLMNQYPDEHPVTLIRSAGMPEERVEVLPLYELDRHDCDHLTTLYVPPLPQPGGLETFQDTIARLRAPDGCPWDREQTHQTLRRNLLEETYEALHALDADDREALCEELGDLLLQIVLHSQMAVEAGEFSMAQVIARIDAKIKRRHPHVFGNVHVTGAQEVIANWEAIKHGERQAKASHAASALSGVPLDLPALAQAEAYGQRAARLGFDWPDVEGVLDKVNEELCELRQAAGPEMRTAEFGDLLFTLVNVARWLDIDPEAALRQANARFARRFRAIEEQAQAQGRRLSEMNLTEMEQLWQTAKQSRGGNLWETL